MTAPPATLAPTKSQTAMRLEHVAVRRFERSIDVGTQFLESHADAVARGCLDMARRFRRGGRLLVFGTGPAATDAQHVAVEFVHPVLVGKRALPAIALTGDVATLTASRDGSPKDVFGTVLTALGRGSDIALGISTQPGDETVVYALERARGMGMLTIALAAAEGTSERSPIADFVFVVPTDDVLVAQEVQETVYHILWELVHVFLDHPASAEDAEERPHA